MNEELALELVEELRDEYAESPVIGGEVQADVINNRHQDSFEVLGQWIPIIYDWLLGDSLPGPPQINVSSRIANLHDGERWYLIDKLNQADNVPTETIPSITHNNFIDPLSEVYTPTQLYVPRSGPFLEHESRQAIESIVETFDDLDFTWLNTNNADNVETACYAVRREYIRFSQCTRLPLNRTDWLPERTHDINGEISEHPLYCSYGMSAEIDPEYVLAIASILSEDPHIRDNGAVKILIEQSD